jgi:superfamily II RNA helicase
MRKIKKKINNELQREILIQNQIKEDLASLQSAQSPNYAIQDEADIPEEETKEDGKIDNDEMSLINYDHPFMRGLEFGILGYNKLMNPALQRVSQYLINKYPFITFSDESLAVGINYPIKTVMLLGGLKGEPLEAIDNALAHQAIGRAGRRGLDIKSVAIYSGVIIEDILIQKYKHIIPNDVEMIASMFESDDMKNYVRTNTRPVPPPPPAQAPPTTKPTPKPIVNISSQTTISDNVGIGSGGGTSSAIEIDFGNFESWEDAADALDSSS